ncbi:MAG: phosphoribosylamine--glycine ligase [Trueperaceae bacterium]
MKVVVVGTGGREHALAWALRQGEAEIAMVGAVGNVEQLAEAVLSNAPELVVVGPEAPLVAGLADALRGRGVPVFGPSKAAARLEGSKAFAKSFMERWGVPTARYAAFDELGPALDHLGRQPVPIVVKDSGLAAGKGVTVAKSRAEAEAAVRAVFDGRPAAQVILEDFLTGPELTVMLFADETSHQLLPPARDHKRLRDGDLGPMTGGMGAVAPVTLPDAGLLRQIEETIVVPVLRGVREEGMLYRGVLYVGLMLTPAGPKVLEFNVRFGDPEAQAVLPLLASSAPRLFLDVAQGRLTDASVTWRNAHAACVVLAAPGYPEAPVKGVEVRLPERLPDRVHVFAGGMVARGAPHVYSTSGGRVLSVVAVGQDAAAARAAAYDVVASIEFAGAQFRTDVGK